MTLDAAEGAPARQVDLADRFHRLAIAECGSDGCNILTRVHNDGTITMQIAPGAGSSTDPEVQTLSLPRGHCGFVGSYSGAPGLSIDVHRDYVEETDEASIRRDALAILEVLSREVWDTRHRVGSR
ncbi:hypothetical protein [Saliphagus sp. LR7]|uniref:hypothetical protein n=1 Tax=Saliphagus sp. LR7 TaxID=2282654 RepID=UPI000DF7BA80|nr:hypothetical protein [Saliphagus sp. LR7]